MNLSEILQENRILINMKATSKNEVITEMVQAAIDSGIDMDMGSTVSSFMERESLGSTGIGLGVAIPHIRIEAVDQCMMVFGKSVAGIDYAAIDNKPAHLFFMIFGPSRQERQENYLKLMATISRMLRNSGVREALIATSDPAGALRFFQEQGTN